ncbi:VWA domain-containing protein [Sulfurovum sp.]|uniref:vWA domain-containing protein n=1 Tax=Sulfurovum sp. TaxID=1969726 RepID=UPI0025D4A1D8|nr:VWA domain-containing protein [Sulfurovum sp.]
MKKILFGFVLVLATLFTSVPAAESPRAVIIFDASGSMWGQIHGKPKIAIAREALKNVVREWNPNVELGLTVYGHRRKGDCNDIETVIPVGRVDKNKVIDTVMKIQPKGKTPISRSLRKAANELKFTEEKATIILISDGKETCDPDPCGTAKELEKEGIDFVTHVIGFNVDKKTDKQLECIAHATGGAYFSAKNAAALNKAMKSIVKKVEKPKAPVLTQTEYTLVARYNMSPKGLNVSGVKWAVSQEGKVLYSGNDEAPKVDVKVGKIHVKAAYDRTGELQSAEGDMVLKPQAKNHTVIMIKSGKVTIDLAEEKGGLKVKGSVYIYPIIDGKPNRDDQIVWCVPTKKKACERILPIGKYYVEATYDSMKAHTEFTLANKEEKTLHLFFRQTGNVEVTASEKEGGKWIDAGCRLYNEDKSDSWYVGPRKKKAGTKQVPVGKYTLNCEYNAFKRKDIPVEIKAGETTKLHVVMGQTGKVEVTASEKEGGKWIDANCRAYKVVDGEVDDSDNWYIGPRKKEAGTKQLPVGKYLLKCEYNRFKKEAPFEVTAGKVSKVHVIFSPFVIGAKCSNGSEKVSYEIYASSGQLVYDKKVPCSKMLNMVLDEGKYRVEASVSGGTGEAAFEVGAGKPAKLILDLTNLNHEEEIKADSSETVVVPVQPKKTEPATTQTNAHSVTIGDKKIQIEGISEKNAADLKKAAAMLQMLGGMMQGNSAAVDKEKKPKQSSQNEKADKEFDEMSKDLDMFTK